MKYVSLITSFRRSAATLKREQSQQRTFFVVKFYTRYSIVKYENKWLKNKFGFSAISC